MKPPTSGWFLATGLQLKKIESSLTATRFPGLKSVRTLTCKSCFRSQIHQIAKFDLLSVHTIQLAVLEGSNLWEHSFFVYSLRLS